MKVILLILLFFIEGSCDYHNSQNEQSNLLNINPIWIQKEIKWKILDESDSTLYSNGKVLYFDSTGVFKMIRSTMYKKLNSDSIAFGHEGMDIYKGKWNKKGLIINLNYRLIDGMFISKDKLPGPELFDSIKYSDDSEIFLNNEKFLSFNKLSYKSKNQLIKI